MATQPKPKPKPDPDPPVPGEDENDEAAETRSSDNLHERVEALFASQVALIERVDRLEERVAAPPVGIGRRA